VDPLLPIEIQRQLGMPGVTPEACVAEARAIIGCWRSRAGELVLSWPQFENDTEAVHPGRLQHRADGSDNCSPRAEK
jgi:hypothetical protein